MYGPSPSPSPGLVLWLACVGLPLFTFQAVGQSHPDVITTLNNLHSTPHHPQGQATKEKADPIIPIPTPIRSETNDLGRVLQNPLPLTSPGASNPLETETVTTTKEFLSNLQGKPHLKEIFANLQHVVDLMEFSSSATIPFTTTTTTTTTTTKKGKQQKQKNLHKDNDEELMAGAKLLSKGFAITSNVCGLVADGVRVSGDTTAGLLGSSVKLLGMGVKSVSTGLYVTSRLLDGTAAATTTTTAQGRKPLTAERLRRRHETTTELKKTSILRNTRQLAAKSVRLVGNILGGVGESIVATGMATEEYGSATVGIAEDAVRILEDFAGSLAAGFVHRKKSKVRLRRIRQLLSRSSGSSMPENSNGEKKEQDDDESTFLFMGTHPGTCDEPEKVAAPYSTQLPAALVRLWDQPSIEAVETITVILGTQLVHLGEFVMQDVEGVSSMATELMVIMALLFLVSLLLLLLPCQRYRLIPPKPKDSGGDPIPQNIHICYDPILECPASFADTMSTIDDSSDDWTAVVGKASEPRSSLLGSSVLWMARWSWKRLLAATKLLRICLSAILFVFLNRVTLLVYVYIVAWLYLSRASQLRAMSIQRVAEAKGFRSAIALLGTDSFSSSETVFWLNAFFDHIWRVPFGDGKTPILQAMQELGYPLFVSRAVQETLNSPKCTGFLLDADSAGNCLPYGGLEPFITSKLGTAMIRAFETDRELMPTDVSYLSLYSFTLGSRPPVIRSAELVRANLNGRRVGDKVELDLDLDVLFSDLSLVLEAKLSTLQYALLPSTKLAIQAADLRLPLKLSISFSPDFPYVSAIEFSLRSAPNCHVRIVPFRNDSGMHGMDIGSMPLFREMVQGGIKKVLSSYVTPKFITLDIAAILDQQRRARMGQLSNMHGTHSIDNLRQRTKPLITPNPRTSTPEPIAITSVADKLPSHHSAVQPVTCEERKPIIFKRLVKPKTEVSRMGMDRWIAGVQTLGHVSHEYVTKRLKPATEVGRAGMDRFPEDLEEALTGEIEVD